jgi:hypothetical protein
MFAMEWRVLTAIAVVIATSAFEVRPREIRAMMGWQIAVFYLRRL